MTPNFWRASDVKPSFLLARNTTRQWARSFFLATQLLPEPKRWATYALYGFCRYADNLVDMPREKRSTFELKSEVYTLAEELELAFRTGESQHPVIKPVVLAAREFEIPLQPLLDLLLGVEMDLDRDRYETFDDLYLFCYRVAGTVGMMMTPVLGTDHNEAPIHAEALGIAMQLTNILRDVQEDAERGRIYLPLDELDRFGVSEQDILDGTMSPGLRELMEYQIARARSFYAIGESGIDMLHSDARFAIRAASRIYGSILERIEDQDCNPFAGRAYLGRGEKLRVLTKEYLADKVGSVLQGERTVKPSPRISSPRPGAMPREQTASLKRVESATT